MIVNGYKIEPNANLQRSEGERQMKNSPYLDLPLRTFEQAQREIGKGY